jgi:predicted HAD superfamily Cof-like phosphohydrolase
VSLPENRTLQDVIRPRGTTVKILAKRKSAHQLRIEEFHNQMTQKAGRPEMPSCPTTPNAKMCVARCKLILEEALEVCEACGVSLYVSMDGDGGLVPVRRQDIALEHNPDRVDSLDHIAKEVADLSVVTIGTFADLGIADVPVLEEVDANNLAKFGPGGHLDANLKWKKPPGHPSPDIAQVLVDQGWKKPEVSREEVQECREDVPVSNS